MILQRYQRGKLHFLAYPAWYEAGIVHGFTGADFDFSSGNHQCYSDFCEEFAVSGLVSLKQVHGVEILDFRTRKQEFEMGSEPEADGMIVSASSDVRVAYGIRTADCMPIIVRDGDTLILVHAGWRGLAGGILERALSLVSSDAEILIGPCAGAIRYQVGADVIAAFGGRASYAESSGTKSFLLDLPGTAAGIAQGRQVLDCGICTLSQEAFHSHRRDQDAGRNLCFVVPQIA